jgi:acetyl-CoA acetyltransferase
VFNVANACATGATALRTVIMAIKAGECDMGLAVGVEKLSGAGMLGAGFGGAVWAMVAGDSADGFRANWQRHYLAAFPQHAAKFRSFVTRPGDGAGLLESMP